MKIFSSAADVISLKEIDTEPLKNINKDEIIGKTQILLENIQDKQQKLFAEKKSCVLLILQGLDGSGKDSLTRHVIGKLNPQSVKVTSFKAPEPTELAHDYLWRIHKEVPPKGYIGVFNRSHYEDVLVVRVENIKPENIWRQRFEQINNFEKMLSENDIFICKFYLHISKEEQRKKLDERQHEPEKRWKYDPKDEIVHKKWNDYMEAYHDVFKNCASEILPWYIVPADKKWYRDYLVAKILSDKLDEINPRFP